MELFYHSYEIQSHYHLFHHRQTVRSQHYELGFGPAVWTRGLSADCHPLSADRISGIFFGYPPFTVTYPIIPGYPWIPTIIHGYPSDIRLNLVSSNFWKVTNLIICVVHSFHHSLPLINVIKVARAITELKENFERSDLTDSVTDSEEVFTVYGAIVFTINYDFIIYNNYNKYFMYWINKF